MRRAAEHPINGRMIFVSATDGAGGSPGLVAAWDRYQGGCLPRLRDRLAGSAAHLARVRLISAEHGLLHPLTNVPPETGVMTEQQAREHQPLAMEKLRAEFTRDGMPRELMVLTEFPYSLVIDDLFHVEPPRPHISLFTMTPGGDRSWTPIAAKLDDWGWP